MRVHLVNPSDLSFGVGVITPRWLFVLAAATPREYGDPQIVDETIEKMDFATIQPGDVVGIGIHTLNTLRGFEVGRAARERGAWVVFGGVHTTLYPEEPLKMGGAHASVKGDGDVVWAQVVADCAAGKPQEVYEGGLVGPDQFRKARWDLMPKDTYMWASVQTLRGCPKHCSFCSVWRTDGQKPRQRQTEAVIEEVVALRRQGFRFIALADDNFYPVTLEDLRLAERQGNQERLQQLRELRAERFDLMKRLAQLPKDLNFFTQITTEAADDSEFLDAMRAAHIRGALVGIESVTEAGLKGVFKDFNFHGEELVEKLQKFRQHGVYVLGSFIFGLKTDERSTFDATAALALRADVAFAQFVMLTPLPGTVDFLKWEKDMAANPTRIAGHPLTRYWLIPQQLRPKLYIPHPEMTSDEIRVRTQQVWDQFYSLGAIWHRARITPTLRSRLAFLLISKLYRQMYANTGIATDSARTRRATNWARMIAKPCRRLFQARPMPDLQVPAAP